MAIHLIAAWSGDEQDESPICGADKNAVDVWGHRTAAIDAVTCEACKALARDPDKNYRLDLKARGGII